MKAMVTHNCPSPDLRFLVGRIMAKKALAGCVILNIPGVGQRMVNWAYLQLVI